MAMLVKLFRFWLAGLPAFAVALSLNYLLVTYSHLPKPVAYVIVLFCQLTVNFFACRHLVFRSQPDASIWQQYRQFLAGMGFFRLLDLGVYAVLVEVFHLNYLAIQILNIFVFSLLKYKFSERLFEGTQQ